jgi:4'-phosphopantetheinyl transferase
VVIIPSCLVWWASLAALTPEHAELLSAAELTRAHSYRREDDRRRFLLGAALLRLLVAELTGSPPAAVSIDRSCGRCGLAHGRPRVVDSTLYVSVSHSADVVVVAAAQRGRIGVDVEQVEPVMAGRIPPLLLAPGETVSTAADIVQLWTRKEAVVKATGDGMRVPLEQVVLAADGELTGYPGQLPTARVVDFDAVPGYRGALAMLTASPFTVEVTQMRNWAQRPDAGNSAVNSQDLNPLGSAPSPAASAMKSSVPAVAWRLPDTQSRITLVNALEPS